MELVRADSSLARQNDLLAMLLADKRSENTKRAYAADLADFFGGHPSPEAVGSFLSQDSGGMALSLNGYKARLLTEGLSESTVNRRLAAIKSLVKYGRRIGVCSVDPRGLVDSEKVKQYRDTAGVGLPEMKKLLALPDTKTIKGKRDSAILRLLWENGLRRSELCKLSVSDLWPGDRTLYILGKGRGTQKEPVELSERTIAAIMDYLTAAGRDSDTEGPLFVNCDRRQPGGRLTAGGLYKLIESYGKAAGISRRLSPHRIRHSAITAALDSTGGNVRMVQRFSRHAKLETLMIYDDNRRNFQADVTGMLSGLA